MLLSRRYRDLSALRLVTGETRVETGPQDARAPAPRRRSPARSVVGGDALDATGHELTVCELADIAKADHADHPLALVDDRQPPDLQLLHVMHRLGQVVIVTAAVDTRRHHLA